VNVILGAYLLSGQPGFRQAGVHYYAKRLLQALTNVETRHGASLQLTALVSPTAATEVSHLQSPISVRFASRTTEEPFSRIYVEQVETPGLLRQMKADLYHGLGFVAPLRAPCPTVVSVMDLSFVTQPQTHKRFNRTYLSWLCRESCRRAARVIAISEWTKRDVVQHFGISPEQVDVTPLGVDHDHFKPTSPDELAAFKAQHGIGEHAIFYLGSLEPRKNLTRLIEAFAHMVNDSMHGSNQRNPKSKIENRQLFIGGSLAWKYDEVLSRIEALGLADRVKLLGRVTDDDLPKWYSACAVMAYPSLYEGFGLPPLEAMACGAPVVTSNVTSLPEVVGDAGIMVEPTDAKALAKALSRVLCDDALRAEMRTKSLARAAQFTWARTAELTMESYRKVMAKRS
jgi:glycosyltransferase involved in cell wall biosynthesis